MRTTSVEELVNKITTSNDKKQFLIGSREQSKTDIIVECAIKKFETDIDQVKKSIFLVVEKSQKKKLLNKFIKKGFKHLDLLNIFTYTEWFNDIYINFTNLDNKRRLIDFDNPKDYRDLLKEMEMTIVQRNMHFEEYPPHLLWKNFENFSYGRGVANKESFIDKKIFSFCINFLRSFINAKWATKYIINLFLTSYIKDKNNRNSLENFMSKFENIYCDDVHYLANNVSRFLHNILKLFKNNVVVVADRFYTPDNLFSLDGNNKGTKFFIEDEEYKQRVLITSPNLENNQILVYKQLMFSLNPLVPVSTDDFLTYKNSSSKKNDSFNLIINEASNFNFHQEIMNKILNLGPNKEIAIYHDCPVISSVLEAELVSREMKYKENTNYSFWNNPANIYVMSYFNFLAGVLELSNFKVFLDKIIPKFSTFEEEAMNFIKDGIKCNFLNISLYDYIPKINSISKEIFETIINDLIKIKNEVRSNWKKNSYKIFHNAWLKKYYGLEEVATLIPEFILISEETSKIDGIKSIFSFCDLVFTLRNSEFSDSKARITISDLDLFSFKKHDVVILIRKDVSKGDKLWDQTPRVLNSIYKVAGSFKEKLVVYICNTSKRKGAKEIVKRNFN